MEKQQYVCEKCVANMHYVSDQFQATWWGTLAKIFDVQNKKLLQLAVPNAALTRTLPQPNKRRHECVLDFLLGESG